MYNKRIDWDEELRCWACYLDGELVACENTRLTAEEVLNGLVRDRMFASYWPRPESAPRLNFIQRLWRWLWRV